MQYHIFEISPFQQLTHLQSVASYRAAKQLLRELRTASGILTGTNYRMMYALDPLQAELLLQEKREPRPMGEHD